MDEVWVELDEIFVKRLVTDRLPLAELDAHVRGGQIAFDAGGRITLPISEYHSRDRAALHALLIELSGFDYRQPVVEARRLGRPHARQPDGMSVGFAGEARRSAPVMLVLFLMAMAIVIGGALAGEAVFVAWGAVLAAVGVPAAYQRGAHRQVRIVIDPMRIHIYDANGVVEAPFNSLSVEVVERLDFEREIHFRNIGIRVARGDADSQRGWHALVRALSTALGYDITRPREEARRLARLARR